VANCCANRLKALAPNRLASLETRILSSHPAIWMDHNGISKEVEMSLPKVDGLRTLEPLTREAVVPARSEESGRPIRIKVLAFTTTKRASLRQK
jgi:hypothetical protein